MPANSGWDLIRRLRVNCWKHSEDDASPGNPTHTAVVCQMTKLFLLQTLFHYLFPAVFFIHARNILSCFFSVQMKMTIYTQIGQKPSVYGTQQVPSSKSRKKYINSSG